MKSIEPEVPKIEISRQNFELHVQIQAESPKKSQIDFKLIDILKLASKGNLEIESQDSQVGFYSSHIIQIKKIPSLNSFFILGQKKGILVNLGNFDDQINYIVSFPSVCKLLKELLFEKKEVFNHLHEDVAVLNVVESKLPVLLFPFFYTQKSKILIKTENFWPILKFLNPQILERGHSQQLSSKGIKKYFCFVENKQVGGLVGIVDRNIFVKAIKSIKDTQADLHVEDLAKKELLFKHGLHPFEKE